MDKVRKAPNAEKWTEERVLRKLAMIELAMEDTYCFFLGSTLNRLGMGRHVWSYWKQKFAANEDIMERMLLIDSGFEAKIMDAGLHGLLPAMIASRTLRCGYKWRAMQS